MRLEKASHKAIRYACMNFHYAKSVPVNVTGYSVFNDASDWCGVVLFGLGANKNLPKLYKLNQGEVSELLRMALNGKHGETSKALSISMKLFKKHNPLVKLLISYADENHNHTGVIYQASNWYYDGDSQTVKTPMIDGKRVHAKTLFSKYGTNSIAKLNNMGVQVQYAKDMPKRRYIYPLDKSLISLCETLKKPYPKKTNAAVAHKGECPDTIRKGAFDSTTPLQVTVTKQ